MTDSNDAPSSLSPDNIASPPDLAQERALVMIKNTLGARSKRRSCVYFPNATSIIERFDRFQKHAKVKTTTSLSATPSLGSEDRRLLSSVSRGDLPAVRRILEKCLRKQTNKENNADNVDERLCQTLDINCTDALGRTSLRIAIENENIEIVELLLQYDQIDVSDALLHAIQNESVGSVVLLLNHVASKNEDPKVMFGASTSTSFTPDMTPIMLASIKDNFAIIHLLLESGFLVPRPHNFRCRCDECDQHRRGSHKNSLGTSRSRLNTFSALASPSLICLTSADPLLTAFELSSQMQDLARQEVEFRLDYNRLAEQCRQFAVDLLDQVRDSYELSTILNYDPELRYFKERHRAVVWRRRRSSAESKNTNEATVKNNGNDGDLKKTEDDSDDDTDGPSLSRLKLAIKYKQKQFIAHPSCQQFLSSIWYSAIPGFRQMPVYCRVSVLIAIGLLSPLLCFANMLSPCSKYGSLIRQPFTKCVCHAASYLTFLGLVMSASQRFDIGSFSMVETSADQGPMPTATEWTIVIFVFGNIWADAKSLWNLGVQNYLGNRWNLLNFVINKLFVCVILLRSVTITMRLYSKFDMTVKRPEWVSSDPNLVAECVFAIASVFVCLRLLYLFTFSPTIGPLQIAFGHMLADIAKFGIVYAVLLLAFSCGLNQVYWFYANNPNLNSVGFLRERCFHGNSSAYSNKFKGAFEIVQSLYWGLFSLVDLDTLGLMGKHKLTAFIAKLLFGSYTFMGVIVLVNALIAMMSDSYKKIQRQSDVEWKFALAKLWLSYFDETYELPVPFNLLPSFSSFKNCGQGLSDCCQFISTMCSNNRRAQTASVKEDAYINEIFCRTRERTLRYQQTVQGLAKRYLMKRQENSAIAGVTEDDMVEIKQDVSAFKYELLEILRYNGMKFPDYINQSTLSPASNEVPAPFSYPSLGTSLSSKPKNLTAAWAQPDQLPPRRRSDTTSAASFSKVEAQEQEKAAKQRSIPVSFKKDEKIFTISETTGM